MGIGKGDEVIVPAFTMGSCWLAVLYTGATPIFVDASLKSWCIDAESIERKITRKTKAIMPVHIYGQPCDMSKIMIIAGYHGIEIIEDACEGLGALWRDEKCGTFGDIACFSFFANKLIATGEGGMVVTDNDIDAKKLRKLRDMCFTEKRFIHNDIGYNYRMTNLQAAVGCGEIEHINEYIKRKLEIANIYNDTFEGIDRIKKPNIIRGTDNIYWMYGILIDELAYGMTRDELREVLRKDYFIDTRNFFYPPADQPILETNEYHMNANYLSRNGLYLPSGLGTRNEDIKYVANTIAKLQKSKY